MGSLPVVANIACASRVASDGWGYVAQPAHRSIPDECFVGCRRNVSPFQPSWPHVLPIRHSGADSDEHAVSERGQLGTSCAYPAASVATDASSSTGAAAGQHNVALRRRSRSPRATTHAGPMRRVAVEPGVMTGAMPGAGQALPKSQKQNEMSFKHRTLPVVAVTADGGIIE